MSKTTPALDMVEQSNRILSDWDARVQAYIDAGHDRDVAEQLARYQTERENRQKVARFVHEQTKKQIKANTQGQSGKNKDKAKAVAWIRQAYRENFRQYTFLNGKPSPVKFVRAYATIGGVAGRMKAECPYGGRDEEWIINAIKGIDPTK